jgi:hypothetical protein
MGPFDEYVSRHCHGINYADTTRRGSERYRLCLLKKSLS